MNSARYKTENNTYKLKLDVQIVSYLSFNLLSTVGNVMAIKIPCLICYNSETLTILW